ncbi:MAG: glycosyltransferase, partial [Candidatus Aquicultorales bacterium]
MINNTGTHPLITIVIPTLNSARFLEDSILSVINQTYEKVELIIIDGGSTDGTLNIIDKYKAHIQYWASESDNGLYDAINKGFEAGNGTVLGWLNSDDIYMPWALSIVADILSQPGIEWCTGIPSVLDENNRVVGL